MARWVKSYNQMRIYKQAATPSSASDGLKVGDIWIDTTSGAIVKVCTAVDADTFDIIADTVSPSFTTPTLGVASATSINFGDEALANYDEGSWTPVVTSTTPGTLSIDYASQIGTYTRVGNTVLLNAVLVFTPTLGTASGKIRITGFPFVAKSGGGNFHTIPPTAQITFPTSSDVIYGLLQGNTSYLELYGIQSGGAVVDSNIATHMTNAQAGTIIQFTISYRV